MEFLLVILAILKVIGIILLILLGVILSVLLMILFIPIKYRVELDYDNELYLNTVVSWFFKLFYVKFVIKDGKNTFTIRAIKKIKDKDKELSNNTEDITYNRDKIKESDEKEKTVKEEVKSDKDQKDNIVTNEKNYNENDEPKDTTKNLQNVDEKIVQQKVTEVNKDGINSKDTSEKETKKETDKTTSTKKQVNSKKEKNKTKVFSKSKKDIIKENMFGKVQKFISHKDRKNVFKKTKIILKKLYKHIKPKKMDMDIELGFDDPSKTGYTIATLSTMKPFIDPKNKINFVGNFNQDILKIKGFLKGSIYIYYLIYLTAKLLLDKQVKNFIEFSRETFK